jgi:hypothetical protein
LAGTLAVTARAASLDVLGFSIHPPLAGTAADHAAEISALIAGVDPRLPVWVSHLDVASYRTLPTTHRFRLRLGTALWHGDKAALQLSADVLEARPVAAGEHAGYRLGEIISDGHLVIVGAGTAHGLVAFDAASADGYVPRSPFHFRRQRLALHESPHMHTSMCFVRTGDPLPRIGDRVDVQRPLTMTDVDEFEWL